MRDIRFCPACRKHTLTETCDCTMQTVPVFPPKHSPQDKYASYRRKAKEAERKAAGVL
jgi:rRNA maturation protein Nop10